VIICSLHHICIQSADIAASLDFYVRVLGFEVLKESKGFHDRAYNGWLRIPGRTTGEGMMIELQSAKTGRPIQAWSADQGGPVHFALLVENIEQAYASICAAPWTAFKRKNGEALYDVEGSLLFKVLAPEGTEIEIRDVADL
jgi:glyoxylase I family protein